MPLPALEIDLLRAFVAVADAGSFTGAARAVGRTQSAVSQKVLRLEDLLGRRVFKRSSRSLSLTQDGERLIGPARQMLDFNDQTIRQFAEPAVAGKLRLGVSDDFIPHQLPRLVARFKRAYPDVELDLQTGLSCELVSSLNRGDLDLAIAKRDGRVQSGRVIWREPLVWIAADGFEVDDGGPVPLVLLPQPCSYRKIMLDALESVGRASIVVCTTSSLMGVQSAVAGGLGVTVLGRSFIQDGLKVLAVSKDWPPLPMTEIVLLGEDGTRKNIVGPLASFVIESLTMPRA